MKGKKSSASMKLTKGKMPPSVIKIKELPKRKMSPMTESGYHLDESISSNKKGGKKLKKK